jgi:hypothetical protein
VVRGVRRSSGPLDARAQAILRAVIEEYVETVVPVGSHTLVERHPMGVSSATVRNILAGEQLYDVWGVNEDAEYHEAGRGGEQAALASIRQVPQRVRPAA